MAKTLGKYRKNSTTQVLQTQVDEDLVAHDQKSLSRESSPPADSTRRLPALAAQIDAMNKPKAKRNRNSISYKLKHTNQPGQFLTERKGSLPLQRQVVLEDKADLIEFRNLPCIRDKLQTIRHVKPFELAQMEARACSVIEKDKSIQSFGSGFERTSSLARIS